MKRCILCGLEANFVVKNSSEYYCKECGEMQFGSIDMLVPIEKQLSKIKLNNK